MKHCFPSWSDIRKRTKTSFGGSLLAAYAKQYGTMQEAIEAYQKIFFLVNYKGHEEEFPDYLYAATVGVHEGVKIDSIICKLTEDEPYFLSHLDSSALQTGAYVLFHESLLPKDTKAILYTVGKNQYSADLIKIPIWNAFDEFAKFAGLERYEGETNKELEARTYAVFKNFPNPTDAGIKRAIMDAVVPFADIHPEEITIEPLNHETLDFSDKTSEDIYEQFVQFNHDLFRTKVWNMDTWEHGFQKQGYIPHAWDKAMEVTQDGVGYNDSLKVSYLKDLDKTGLTDVEVYAYKKDFEKVKQYVAKNQVEDDISLKLSKYNDDIQPKKVEYAIHAYTVKKLDDPQNIRIRATKKRAGTMDVSLSELALETYGVEKIEQGHLQKGKRYQLSFCPKGDFSTMAVSRCRLLDGKREKDLRQEYGQYKMVGNVIRNSYVRAHVESIADTSWNDNVIDTPYGMTIGNKKPTGGFNVNIMGMENELVTAKASCREVEITNSPYVSGYNGFVYGADGKSLVDTRKDSIGSIVIGGSDNPLLCNSFSFTFDKAKEPAKQGTILVTIIADGKEEKLTCNHSITIARQYEKRIPVQIVIQKYGEDAVSIRKIMMSSYDIQLSLTNGEGLSYLGKTARLPAKITPDIQLRIDLVPYTAAYPVISYVHVGGSLKGASYDIQFDTNNMDAPRLDIESDCRVTLYRLDSSGKKSVVGTKDQYSTRDMYYNNGDAKGQIVLDLTSFPVIESSTPKIEKKFKGTEKRYINISPGETLDSITITGERIQTLSDKPLTNYLIHGSLENWEVYITRKDRGILAWNRETKDLTRTVLYRTDFDEHADSFSFIGFPSDIKTEYVYDNGTRKEVSDFTLDSKFDRFDIYYTDVEEHIAYNSLSMISDTAEDVAIVNTFQPMVSMTKFLYYEAEPPVATQDRVDVTFMKTGRNYSLGASEKLRIKTTLPAANKNSWPLEIHSVKNKFILSSEILLDESCQVAGEWHELQEYILEPPAGIEIHYLPTDEYEEEISVPASKINKLRYSRLLDVSVSGFSEGNDYALMDEEGVLVWKNDDAVGRKLKVSYRVSRPAYLTYTKDYEDRIYKIIEYDSEAYRLAEKKVFRQKKDRDILLLDFKEQPDRIITKCLNPVFASSLRDGVLTILQLRDDDRLAAHNGYIYDEGREYYYFNDKYQDQIERVNSTEFHNVSRQRDNMLFHMRSKNYLPNANMETDCLSELCHFDFIEHPLSGISTFNHMSACESYNLWYTVNMDVSLEEVLNGYGFHFKAKRGTGYAAVEITKYIRKLNVLSLYIAGDLVPCIVKETMVDGMPFIKSVFLNLKNGEPLFKDGSYYSRRILEDPEPEAKYYLVLRGTEGKIDDMISVPEDKDVSIVDAHKKNIDRMGFHIKERLPQKFEHELEFTPDGGSYTDLVCSSDKVLSTSSTVEFGLTKVHSVNLTDCSFEYANYKDGSIISARDNTVIRTRPFYVKSASSAFAVYIKINDIISGRYEDFGVRVYGSDYLNNGYTLLREETGTNLVELKQGELKSYLYLEITANESKVISSIEAYARYVEVEGSSLVPTPKESGSFISKVYDLGISGKYRFDGMDADMEGQDDHIACYVRGIRTGHDENVMTPWKEYKEGAEPVVLDGYRLVQFRVDLTGSNTAVKIHDFKIGVV